MYTTGIRVVALLVSLVSCSSASCRTELLRLLIHASLPQFYVLALLVVKRYITCVPTTVRLVTPGRSQQNAQWIWSNTQWGKKYEVIVGYNSLSQYCINFPSSHNMAGTTASLLIMAFPLISNGQPRRQDKIAAYTTWSFISSLLWYDSC
jgi:hypothetical protein